MEQVRTIGIIGAGLSGLVAAKTCLEYGYAVSIFEKDAELGGVWASSRRYPGVTTQNTKDTYYFSDFPMPAHYPQWPSGEQVQDYLIAYAKKFQVFPLIRFGHAISRLDFQKEQWTIEGKNSEGTFDAQFDFVIVCNGTFCDPHIPKLPGMESFLSQGGVIRHSTQFPSTELARNKRAVVVGFSKSATDIANELAATATSTHVVFRETKWKIPRYVKGINMKYLLLNRLGEALIKPPDQHNRMDRFVHRIGLPKKMLAFMENYIGEKQMLPELGLLPTSSISEQAFGEINLETPGFFEKVAVRKIHTEQGEIVAFDGKRAILSTGREIECDLVVFATGFTQSIPFLPDAYLKKFTDAEGNYLLYHHILPAGVPSLAFVGYNSSIQTPISSEFGALWVCEYLKGRIPRPSEEEILQEGKAFIKWRSQFRPNGASKGLSTMPGTIHHVDMLLRDMKAPLPFLSLIPDWLLIIKPGRYKGVRKKIVKRNH